MSAEPLTLTLPLRGLASEGAQEIVERALAGLVGVVSVRASIAEQLLHIEYDKARLTQHQIHDALRRADIIHGAHG